LAQYENHAKTTLRGFYLPRNQGYKLDYYLTELNFLLKGYSMYFRVAGARVYFEI
jgi:hypothetical protein